MGKHAGYGCKKGGIYSFELILADVVPSGVCKLPMDNIHLFCESVIVVFPIDGVLSFLLSKRMLRFSLTKHSKWLRKWIA